MATIAPPPGMGNRYLEVIISPNGETVVEAHGYEGRGCETATQGVEAALGNVKKRTIKRGESAMQRQRLGR